MIGIEQFLALFFTVQQEDPASNLETGPSMYFCMEFPVLSEHMWAFIGYSGNLRQPKNLG